MAAGYGGARGSDTASTAELAAMPAAAAGAPQRLTRRDALAWYAASTLASVNRTPQQNGVVVRTRVGRSDGRAHRDAAARSGGEVAGGGPVPPAPRPSPPPSAATLGVAALPLPLAAPATTSSTPSPPCMLPSAHSGWYAGVRQWQPTASVAMANRVDGVTGRGGRVGLLSRHHCLCVWAWRPVAPVDQCCVCAGPLWGRGDPGCGATAAHLTRDTCNTATSA